VLGLFDDRGVGPRQDDLDSRLPEPANDDFLGSRRIDAAIDRAHQPIQQFSVDDRALFQRAAKEGGLVATRVGEQIDTGGIEELKKADVAYVKPDLEAFRKAFANVHKSYEGKQWASGLVDQIRQMQS